MFVYFLLVALSTFSFGRFLPLRNESFITNDEEFIPTYEWKNVKEGQAIPPGLYVRLNLQTGQREAKLLDDPKVPQDQIGRLLDQLKKTTKIDEQISILKQFEDFLHEYDNAVRFTKLNGLEYLQLLLNDRTTTNDEFFNWIFLTLGAAFQGNDKVQLRAFHLDFLQIFIDHLERSVNVTTTSKIVFALSTFLRNFPAAKSKFIEQRGFEILIRLFDRSESQKKILSLIGDFLIENRNKSIDFSAWCSRVPNHLLSIPSDDFDQIETTLELLIPLTDVCRMDLFDLLERIDQLNDVYSLSESLRKTLTEIRRKLQQRLSSSDL